MATSVIEREMRRRTRRGEVPPAPMPQTLPNRAAAPGILSQLFSNLSPVSQAQAAPAPSPAPAPVAASGPFTNAPAPAPAPAASPPPSMMARPGGAAMGLRNYAGDEYSNQMGIENFINNQAANQSTALQPTVAPYPASGGFGPQQALLPTGEQYPTVFGRPDPQGVFDPADPAPSWMGNVPRAMVNFLPGVTNELMSGLAEAGKFAVGVPIEAARQAFTSSGERAREDAAAAAEVETTTQPAPAARRWTLQQNAQQIPSSIPAAPVQTVADLAQGTAGVPGVTPGSTGAATAGTAQPAATPATTSAAPIANAGAWNTLPPAALEMAQVWQSRGWSPTAIAGMLGQAAGESGYGVNTAPGDSGTAAGSIFQHRNERADVRARFAQHYGLDPNDPSTEALFVDAEMRGDPASGVAATEDYAWRQLQAAQMPYEAAAAGLHFERPENYDRIQFDPTRVAGWNNRLQGAEQTAALLAGRPLPPYQPSFRANQPPALPDPVDRPIPAQPDYSGVNSWLDTARPQPTDPQAQRQRLFNEILSGVAQGNAAVDTRGAGGVGRLIAAWGKGATGGKAYGDAQTLREQEEYKRSLEGYGMNRAQFAQTEENANVNWKNLRDQTLFSNLSDEQVVDVKNQQSQFATGEGNRERAAEADIVNEANLFKWQQDAIDEGKPQVNVGPYGVTTTYPDGRPPKWEPTRPDLTGSGGANDPLKRLKLLEDLEGPAGKVAQYANLAQLAVETGNDNLITDEIMKDVFAGGYGEGVFPQEYDTIRKEEAKKIDAAYPYLQLQKSAEYATMVEQAVQNKMREIVAQEGANHDWIVRAAGLGVTGAQVFLQLAHPEEASSGGQ